MASQATVIRLGITLRCLGAPLLFQHHYYYTFNLDNPNEATFETVCIKAVVRFPERGKATQYKITQNCAK